MRQFLQQIGVGGFAQCQRHCAPEPFQVVIVLSQIVLKRFPAAGAPSLISFKNGCRNIASQIGCASSRSAWLNPAILSSPCLGPHHSPESRRCACGVRESSDSLKYFVDQHQFGIRCVLTSESRAGFPSVSGEKLKRTVPNVTQVFQVNLVLSQGSQPGFPNALTRQPHGSVAWSRIPPQSALRSTACIPLPKARGRSNGSRRPALRQTPPGQPQRWSAMFRCPLKNWRW